MQASAARSKLIQLIHIAKSDLKMDNDAYRAMLIAQTGLASCADMNEAQLKKVLLQLGKLGFKVKANRYAKPAPSVAPNKTQQISKVGALLADMQLPWEYAHGLAKRMYGRDQVQWCKHEELRGMITVLVNKQAKQKVEAASGHQ